MGKIVTAVSELHVMFRLQTGGWVGVGVQSFVVVEHRKFDLGPVLIEAFFAQVHNLVKDWLTVVLFLSASNFLSFNLTI